MSSEPFPDKDHWQKTADRYLDVARASAATTGTVAILWLVVVGLCVLSFRYDVEHLAAEINEAKEDKQKATARLKLLLEEREEQELLEKQNQPETKKKIVSNFKHNLNLLSEEERKIQCRKEEDKEIRDSEELLYCYKKNQEDAGKTLEKILKDKKVKFQLPALPSFKLSIFVAPVVLSFILLGLAFYIALMRDQTFTYLGRALSILRGELKTPIEKVGDVMSPRNWWIVPLPKISSPIVANEEFAKALGWSYPSQAHSFLIISFWLAHVILQSYLIYLSIHFYVDFLEKDAGGAGIEPGILISFVLMIFCLGITIAIIVLWFRPNTVPGEILRPEEEIEKGRRYFFTVVGKGSAITLISYMLTIYQLGDTKTKLYKSKNLFVHPLRKPRFRKKEPFVSVNSYQLRGLLLYPFTKPPVRIPAYITNMATKANTANTANLVGMRRSQLPKELKYSLLKSGLLVRDLLKKLEPSELIDNSSIRINRSIVSASYEFAAKALFNNNQSENAFKVLMTGMEQDLKYKQRAKLSRGINDHRNKPRKRKQSLPKIVPGQLNWNRELTVSIRLYDLFAKEAVRNERSEWIECQLIPFIEANGLDSVFEHRIAKWTNPESKWYRDLMKHMGSDLLM